MNEGNYDDLSKYRLTRAHETLDEIPTLMSLGYYNTAASRLYYACYYAAVALLVKNNINANKHSGVKAMLGLHFVSTGIISQKSGKAYSRIFAFCQHSDYDDFVYVKKEEIEEAYPKAKEFIAEIDLILDYKPKEKEL
ncbi:MAG: HEPN domain-containing protein [Bacteroidales bacterium]|nr:HEPN domain-containing protein [Bacteroidales bacterium]